MSPLPHRIPDQGFHRAGDVGLRAVRLSDAQRLRTLLIDNRSWLEPWEASYPGGGGTVPGSVPLRPFIRQMHRQQRDGQSLAMVMTYRDEVVGQLTISDISAGALRSASIGYWVSKHVAGRGITPICVALAIDICVQALRLHRVEICIRPENVASLRIVEKLGMRYEGRRVRYIYIDGDWRDHEAFAVTAEELTGSMLGRLVTNP